MNRYKQALLRRLHKPADDGTGGGGGGGGGDDAAAKAAAEKAAAEKEAADKLAAEEAAKKKTPTDEEAKLLKENMQRKAKIDELSKEVDTLKALKTQLEGLGGLDAIEALVKEKKTAEEKNLEAKGEWDRLKSRMAEEHAKTVKELKDAQEAVNKQLNQATSQINELTIGSSFSASEFLKTESTLTATKARVIYGDHFDLKDGKVVGYDKPRSAADRTALVDGYGNPLPFEAAIRKIVEADPEKDSLIKSKAKPGAGSGTRKTDPEKKTDGGSSIDRITAGLKSLGVVHNQ